MNNTTIRIDADWRHDPAAYSRHCERLRRTEDRLKTARVQRLFAGALALLIGVSLVALGVSLG